MLQPVRHVFTSTFMPTSNLIDIAKYSQCNKRISRVMRWFHSKVDELFVPSDRVERIALRNGVRPLQARFTFETCAE